MALSLYRVKSRVTITGKPWFLGKFKTLVNETYSKLVVTDSFKSAAEFARNRSPHFFSRFARDVSSVIDTLEVTALNQGVVLHPNMLYQWSSAPRGILYGVLVNGKVYDRWDGPTRPIASFPTFYNVLATSHDEATAWAQAEHHKELNKVKDQAQLAAGQSEKRVKFQTDTTVTSTVILAENVSFDPTVEVKCA